MKKFFASFVIAASLLQLSTISAFAAADIYIPDSSSSQFLPTVKIIVYNLSYDGNLVPDALGSGTLIDNKGTILTNNHVIQDYYDSASTYDAFQICLTKADAPNDPICNYTATFIERDPSRDIALLRMDNRDVHGKSVNLDFFLEPSSEKPEVGSGVTVIGFPDTGGKTVTITSGLVSGFLKENGLNYIKTDADISFGNSGGTAVSDGGAFIGIPTFIVGSNSAEVLGYLVPISEILDWIDSNKNNEAQKNVVAYEQLKKQIKAYLDANESGTYKNDDPAYEISLVDGWKFASSLEGYVDSEGFGLGFSSASGSVSIFPEVVEDYAPTSVTVYNTDYSYDVNVDDVMALLDDFYKDGYSEGTYYEVEFNGNDAVFESSSYADWWVLNGATVYTDTYHIPYGSQVVSVTTSYVDADFENGYHDDIQSIMDSVELDLSKIVSKVVSEVKSSDPKISVKNTVSDFYLSDASYEYDGVNYFGVNFGKKGDYNFYLSLYYNIFWPEDYIGDWDRFEKETLDSVGEWADIANSGHLTVDGHEGFYYTDEYDSGYGDQVIYSTSIYIKNDDNSYFYVYYSQGADAYRENLSGVVKILKNVKLDNNGKGIYDIPDFLGAASKKLADIKNYVYEENIKNLNRNNAFEVAPGLFEPESMMGRKDFVVWAVRTLQGSAAEDFAAYEDSYNGCQDSCMQDVDYTSPDAVYIEYAKSKGAVGANGWFAPDAQTSMMAALKILVELNDYKVWEAPAYVPWYLPYLHYGYSNYGIPLGVTDINHLLSRGEGAFMIDFLSIQPGQLAWY